MDQRPTGSSGPSRPRTDSDRRTWRSSSVRGRGRNRTSHPASRDMQKPFNNLSINEELPNLTCEQDSSNEVSMQTNSRYNLNNQRSNDSSAQSGQPSRFRSQTTHSNGGRWRNRNHNHRGQTDDRRDSEMLNVTHDSQTIGNDINRYPQIRRPRGRTSNLRYLDSDHQRVNREEATVAEDFNNQDYFDSTINELNPNQPSTSSKNTSNNQGEIAESQLKSNSFECMICCDNIHRSNPIWYCCNCYNIFHLKCAIEWCNKSIKSRNEAIANAQYPSLGQPARDGTGSQESGFTEVVGSQEGYSDYRAGRLNSVEWPCPTCREVLYSRPGKYKCFCGKIVRPEPNKHLTPHSCGQLCGRKRPNVDCPHTCNSICHPGRCAPCPLSSRKPCYCGKLIKEVKCLVGTSSCGQVCGKPLPCGTHFCEMACHEGSCGSCEEVLVINCYCGDQEVRKRCSDLGKKASTKFSCGKVCEKMLDCGKHYCPQKCHPGPGCSSCKFLSQNIRTCPCGSNVIKKALLSERKSCTDPVPTCENKCNAILICGPEKNHHRCQKKCHTGACPPCKLKSTAHCECKLSTKTVDCSLMYEKVVTEDQVCFNQVNYSFECETRCNKPKNCGRHRCNNKCCKAIKNSDPSLHKCEQICNKKLPCGLHNCPETCHPGQCGDCTNIGWEELTCHCGSSVLYPPIPCGANPPSCHRPCRRAHSCGHPVKHECHSDIEKCAPCIVFVKRSCFCSADSKDSVYCYLPGYSCGRTCKKLLACKQHTCKRVCHDNECEMPNNRGVKLCVQPCPVSRYFCKHPCGLPCHGRTPCPTSECKKIMEISCECGNKVERLECYKIMRDVDNRNKMAMLSTNRNNQDSIIVDLSKTSPQAKVSSENDNIPKKLDCDETCSILKRNKALAEALDITQPDLKPVSIFGEDPLRLLKEAVAQDYKFVASTFNTLARFIKSAKESDKRFIFMPFPPAGKLRREIIHELAHHFNCTSESQGDEPFRNVVVRAYKNKSCVPDFTIEQLLPVS